MLVCMRMCFCASFLSLALCASILSLLSLLCTKATDRNSDNGGRDGLVSSKHNRKSERKPTRSLRSIHNNDTVVSRHITISFLKQLLALDFICGLVSFVN